MPRSFSKASRLLVALALVMGAVAFLNATPQPSFAQDAGAEAQTPAQLCENAEIEEPETRRFSQAQDVLEDGVNYQAIFCTGNGPVYVDLYEDYTPVTVNNFVFLAQQGYYNNSTFHRVIADFMAQGGDPVGNPAGTGGPGYQFQDEFAPFLAFSRPGLLAMANAGPSTNGSQFFITRVPTPHLNNLHTIFGEVLEGQEVIDTMQNAEGGEEAEALNTVLIIEDPATVESDYEAPEPATAEEAQAAVQSIFDGVDVYESEDAGVVEDVDAATERFDGDARDIATELYTQNNFAFQAGGLYTLNDCDAETDLLGIGYRLINFENNDGAQSFAASEQLDELQSAQGFEIVEDPADILLRNNFTTDNIYSTMTSEICDRESVVARHIWNFGSYVVEMELIIDNAVFEGQLSLEDLPGVIANLGFELTPAVSEVLLNSDA